METVFSDCRGISDNEVQILISKIFWYNQSDISASYNYLREYKLNQLSSYNYFVELRGKAAKIVEN